MIIKMNARFFLEKQKKGKGRIVMRVSYMARRLEFQTGIKVGDRNFDLSAQKIVGRKRDNVPVELYNRQMTKMRTAIGQVFYSYEMLDLDPEPDDIRKDFRYLMRPMKRENIKGSLPIFKSNAQPKATNKPKMQRKRLGITVFQPRLKVCTFARTNYYEYGKQRQVQESP